MDESIKEDFYRPMYSEPDSDNEVDSFPDFRERVLSNALHGTVKPSGENHRGLQSSSQLSNLVGTEDQEKPSTLAHLHGNYISDPARFNQWLKLNKKRDMAVAKSSKLKGYVLLYWPPCPNLTPGKNRRASFASVIEHGATLAKEWDNGHRVTHIVVDSNGKGREYKDVLENLKLESITEGVQLVTAGWVDDKISPRWGQNYCSEDHFRVFGYTKSSSISPSTEADALIKKREVGNVFASNKTKKAKIQESPPYKHNTTIQLGALVVGNDSSKHPSPKLMKQHQALNFGVHLGMNVLHNNVPLAVNNNNIDMIMERMQRAKDDRDIRELMQRGSLGSELTANGNNIDRIFEPTQDDIDFAYESEKSEEEISTNRAKVTS